MKALWDEKVKKEKNLVPDNPVKKAFDHFVYLTWEKRVCTAVKKIVLAKREEKVRYPEERRAREIYYRKINFIERFKQMFSETIEDELKDEWRRKQQEQRTKTTNWLTMVAKCLKPVMKNEHENLNDNAIRFQVKDEELKKACDEYEYQCSEQITMLSNLGGTINL